MGRALRGRRDSDGAPGRRDAEAMNVRAMVGGRAVPMRWAMVVVRRLACRVLGMTQRVGARVLSGFHRSLMMHDAVTGQCNGRLHCGREKAHEQEGNDGPVSPIPRAGRRRSHASSSTTPPRRSTVVCPLVGGHLEGMAGSPPRTTSLHPCALGHPWVPTRAAHPDLWNHPAPSTWSSHPCRDACGTRPDPPRRPENVPAA